LTGNLAALLVVSIALSAPGAIAHDLDALAGKTCVGTVPSTGVHGSLSRVVIVIVFGIDETVTPWLREDTGGLALSSERGLKLSTFRRLGTFKVERAEGRSIHGRSDWTLFARPDMEAPFTLTWYAKLEGDALTTVDETFVTASLRPQKPITITYDCSGRYKVIP
jgi:hypothetical protein